MAVRLASDPVGGVDLELAGSVFGGDGEEGAGEGGDGGEEGLQAVELGGGHVAWHHPHRHHHIYGFPHQSQQGRT